MKKLKFKKFATALLFAVMVVFLLGGFGSGSSHSKGKRSVSVAFFPMDGYHIKKADGTLGGMDVEYLEALETYANWDISFVECDSWDAALSLVAAKEVDLVGSAQYSAERAALYQYADLASGYTFGTIATNADSPLAYEDFEAMKHITFGMVKTYVRRDEFLQYLADNGIYDPDIREYDSTPALQAALDAHEVDAMVHTFMEIREGQRLIGRFAPRPFYYITYPGNDDVMRELNHAIADLKMNEPELESKLMNEFFQSRLDKTIVFTTDEKKFIQDTGKIRIAYFDGYYPFLYSLYEGECRGLTRELLEWSTSVTGLSLEWKHFDSIQDARQALRDGEIDLLPYSVQNKEELDSIGLVKLKDYTQVPLAIVMDKGRDMHSIRTLATTGYLSDKADEAVDLAKTTLAVYDTQQECMEAVKAGEADAALCDGYLAEYQLSAEIRYYNLGVKRALNTEHGISMAVRKEDYQLESILNKTLIAIDVRAVSDYMMEHNLYSLTSVSQFVQDHSGTIIAILLLIMLIVAGSAIHMVRDMKKIQKLMYKDVEIDIWNMNHLLYWGRKMLTSERRHSRAAIAYLNICQFQRHKVVYGWDSGQKLLELIAEALLQNMKKGEICAKADGDHFVLLLSEENGDIIPRLHELDQLLRERIYHATGNMIEIQMGVCFVPQRSDDLHGSIVCANQAIDFISGGSGENIKVFDETLENAIKEQHEKKKLLDSMDIDKHFTTFYQAKVDVRTEKIVGAEALIRFIDPTAAGAVRSPGFFVPYFEQTGRVTEIDFFVLKCVCQMLRRRLDRGEAVVTISCNFSRIHFTQADFAEHLEGVLNEYQIPRELIEVEVTETLVMEELQQKIAEQTMVELHEKGIRLSIDDFGSGYSSLGVIEKIPASVIKLDRSFLLNKENRIRQVKIMKRIVDLAEDLEAQIVCEGVETDEDVELMKEIGANVAQGYRYAKPVPESEFEKRLTESSRR